MTDSTVQKIQTVALKPCPFCGHKINNQPYWDDFESADDYWVISCPYCGAMIYDQEKNVVIDLWNQRETDKLKDLLIDIDSWHELLGTELLEAFHEGSFDPDANFIPLEHRLKLLYEALGFNKEEIGEEAYKLSKRRLGEEE